MNSAGYEKKDVSIKAIVITGILVILFIAVSLVVINEVFIAEKESLVQEVVLQPESVSLLELQQRENEILNSYKLIDTANNRYRIPIEKAIELVAKQGKLK